MQVKVMPTKTERDTYIAVAPCGCVSAVIALDIATPKQGRDAYDEWTARGDDVRLVTQRGARRMMKQRGFKCLHTPKWGRK